MSKGSNGQRELNPAHSGRQRLRADLRSESPLGIASVSIDYPGPLDPRRGLFVKRRLAALARIENVRVIHPQPWFPGIRRCGPTVREESDRESPGTSHLRMFYLPAVLKGLDSYWVKRVVVRACRDLEAEGPVELIDAHFGYPEGVGCVRAALALRRPVFITMRGLESHVLAHPRRRLQLLWAFEQCTGIIGVSESLRSLAISTGEVDPAKVCVIPNAVDRQLFHSGSRTEARKLLGLDQDGQLIVSVGMLVHGKGHHLLIRALAALSGKERNLRLAIIGGAAHEPKYPEQLQKLIAELGLSSAVLLVGSQPPELVATWLRAADLFALPTYDEGCCNAILEAMACGLPVVTTPVGDNAILVDPPCRGLIVPRDDDDVLAKALGAALQMPWDREEIARHGAEYTWDEVARKTSLFFRERLDATMRQGT